MGEAIVEAHDKLAEISSKVDNNTARLDTYKRQLDRTEQMALSEAFHNAEKCCKIFKKNDSVWALKNEVDKLNELETAIEGANCGKFVVSLTEVIPRNTKVPRFIRATFMTKDDRWDFNKAFNAQRHTHGFTIGSIDPQQHSKWLGD